MPSRLRFYGAIRGGWYKWLLIIVAALLSFFVSMLIYPVIVAIAAVLVLLVLFDFRGARGPIVRSRPWRNIPWVGRSSPIAGVFVVGAWTLAASLLGHNLYASNAAQQVHEAELTKTAIANAHAAGTSQATIRETSVVAQAIVLRTTVAHQHARATVQAIARKTAAPGETSVARARSTVEAVARVRARATAQAEAHIAAQATVQARQAAAAASTRAAQPSGDTYADVNDHPDNHQGDIILWTCNIAKFLGEDPNDSTHTDIGCWEYTGTYDGGTGDGEIALNVPPNINTDSMHSGDDVRVYGTVDQPMQGTNAFGATVTDPQIDVRSLTDLGHDPNASS